MIWGGPRKNRKWIYFFRRNAFFPGEGPARFFFFDHSGLPRSRGTSPPSDSVEANINHCAISFAPQIINGRPLILKSTQAWNNLHNINNLATIEGFRQIFSTRERCGVRMFGKVVNVSWSDHQGSIWNRLVYVLSISLSGWKNFLNINNGFFLKLPLDYSICIHACICELMWGMKFKCKIYDIHDHLQANANVGQCRWKRPCLQHWSNSALFIILACESSKSRPCHGPLNLTNKQTPPNLLSPLPFASAFALDVHGK